MPPRYIYWTIIYGDQATSFRAGTQEELLPTLKQLQSRHPDAVMKYFARGKLWESEEEARQWRDERKPRERTSGAQRRPAEHRGKDWRPGGKHSDPRDRYKVPRDVKRKRFADRLRRDRISPRPPKPRDAIAPPLPAKKIFGERKRWDDQDASRDRRQPPKSRPPKK
jgi:hypothetical protein